MGDIWPYIAWEWVNISLEYTATAWVRLPRYFLAVVAVNLLTHPLFTYLVLRFEPGSGQIALIEGLIFLVEAAVLVVIYGRRRWRTCVFAALVMNAASYCTGLLMDL